MSAMRFAVSLVFGGVVWVASGHAVAAEAIKTVSLVDASSDKGIGTMWKGMEINLAVKSTLNILVTGSEGTKTVDFTLDGKVVRDKTPPFSLFGDDAGNFRAGSFSVGSHTLVLTPYDKFGKTGISKTLTFKVVNDKAVSPWTPGNFQKVFGDEFNGTRLDLSKWWTRYIYNKGLQDRLNDEIQRYRENKNHRVGNGILRLVANPPTGERTHWESGMIRSKKTFKYGYYETRIKMPSGLGVWQTFWLNPEDLRWPAELDFAEFVNNGVEDKPHMLRIAGIDRGAQEWTLIRGINQGGHYYEPRWKSYRAPFNFPDAYHVIGALWAPDDTVTVHVDGVQAVKFKYKWVHNDGTDAGMAHLLMNLAMGGSWAGRHGVTNTQQILEVDYIRVFQKWGSVKTGTSVIGVDLCKDPNC